MTPPIPPFSVLVLAAGQGTRMKSNRAKVLHEVAGEPMIAHVIRAARSIGPATMIVVVGHQAEAVREAVEESLTDPVPGRSGKPVPVPAPVIHYVHQPDQRGTGHAVMMARAHLQRLKGDLLLLYGDVPCIDGEVLLKLLQEHRRKRASMTVLTAILVDPAGYGRIIRDKTGDLGSIVEERDCTPRQRRVTEINSGIYAFQTGDLLQALDRVEQKNAQGEFYLTDAAAILRRGGKRVGTVRHADAGSLLGINTRQELAQASAVLQTRVLDGLMTEGVTIHDPASTFIDARVTIGPDTVVFPQVIIDGPTTIGRDCVIESWTHISRSSLGNRVHIRNGCMIGESLLDDDVRVGPFAHLRMGVQLEEGATVGNFVEMKKSRLGAGSKSMHLTYLGDATIGARVNIGAGTVTCNYDGKRKHPTFIEDEARIGSDTMLVAPVRIGKGAVTGAGAVVTKDVPPGTLAVGVPAVLKKKKVV
ncbi:MAG: bifunctional UDP-N-acetylglucosamine diphosphorylase/glucosamine-1-phosphate N-acetyltransferase GlmU [Acidobacteria bacterium]|nr:bifunctional UDP-N-acetylglucosamine diphosphorylase/glucosamine-1-phosphate N-acetyltransferase GlmU [Acidobacteriota bacterium]